MFLLHPDIALSLPCWLSQFRKAKLRQPTGQRRNKKNSIGPILFLYYEESLVSSNLNSNLLRFHCAHPTLHTWISGGTFANVIITSWRLETNPMFAVVMGTRRVHMGHHGLNFAKFSTVFRWTFAGVFVYSIHARTTILHKEYRLDNSCGQVVRDFEREAKTRCNF